MRAAVLLLATVTALAVVEAPGVAHAQPAPAAQPAAPAAGLPVGPAVSFEPVARSRPGPSGYWTGYRPARGGAYPWRMLAIAGVLLGLTGLLVVRLLRRAAANRAALAAATSSAGSSAARS